MKFEQRALAKKYAEAFLHQYGDACTDEQMASLKLFAQDVTARHELIFLAQLSCVSDARKNEMIQLLAAHRSVDKLIEPLVLLIIKHKRLFMLEDILYALQELYAEKQGIIYCSVYSSHLLGPSLIERIEFGLGRAFDKKIMYTFHVDASLIAGIRIISDSFLWERSIARQLKDFKIGLRL